jgi:hypothetical protein
VQVLARPCTLCSKKCHLIILMTEATITVLWTVWTIGLAKYKDVLENDVILGIDLILTLLLGNQTSKALSIVDECHVL